MIEILILTNKPKPVNQKGNSGLSELPFTSIERSFLFYFILRSH